MFELFSYVVVMSCSQFWIHPVALDLYSSVKRLVSLLVIHIHEKCEKCHIPNQVPFE